MIRLGVIGYGNRIRHILRTIDRFSAGTKVVAIVDPREEELRQQFPEPLAEVKFYDDADRMLDEAGVDGVLIGTRCSLHTPYAVKALGRNLPLFLEKPVATSWEQLAVLKAAMDRSQSQVVVSFPLRVSAVCETARQVIDSGTIGKVEQVQAVNNVPFYAHDYYHGWYRDDSETGGLWLQKATHDFDYINYLVGQRAVRVCAMEAKTVYQGDMPAGMQCVECPKQEECLESPYNLFYRQGVRKAVEPSNWKCGFAVDTGNIDSGSALIQYESGIHAVYSQNFFSANAGARGVTVIGYLATLKFDWYEGEVSVRYHHSHKVDRYRWEGGGEGHFGGDVELAHDFLGIVTGKGRSRTPLEAGIRSVQMCLAARESCQTSTFQEIPPLETLAKV